MKGQLQPSELPIKEIDLSSFEIRLSKETLKDEDFFSLVDSIKQTGVQIPIHVVQEDNGKYEVIDGGRRLRAAKIAGLKSIPVFLVQNVGTELEIRKRALIANIHRKDLEEEERGEALIKYYQCGDFEIQEITSYLKLLGTRTNKASSAIRKKVPDKFEKLSEEIAIPTKTQYLAVKYVSKADLEIRDLAKKQNLWHTDKQKLVSKEITDSKDKAAVKEAQKNLITSLSAARNTSRKYERRQSQEAIQREADNIKEKEKRPKRTMSAEETAEAEEARRKDRVMNPFRLMGVLNGGLTKTWEGLTQEKYVPALIETDTELEQKHLKPTHQFRVDLANVIPKKERTLLGNWLMFIRLAIEDMESVLEKADKTAYDTRE